MSDSHICAKSKTVCLLCIVSIVSDDASFNINGEIFYVLIISL